MMQGSRSSVAGAGRRPWSAGHDDNISIYTRVFPGYSFYDDPRGRRGPSSRIKALITLSERGCSINRMQDEPLSCL